MKFPKKTLPTNSQKLLGLLKNQAETVWAKRGAKNALELFREMSKRVPAYKKFLHNHKFDPDLVKTIADFQKIPITNKENYLLSYNLEELCWDGKFAGQKWTIASTSGSTGEPFYFPRTEFQDEQFMQTADVALTDIFEIDKKTTLFIDCFALGVWIGGMFMYQAIKYLIDSKNYPLSIITPGADKTEAMKSIKNLASKFDQIIIGGYAPLVKDLIDVGASKGINWNQLHVKYFFAAEGFTEGFRDYLIKKGGAKNILTDSLNHYGTADLGTMAHETPLSIMIRRDSIQNEQLAIKLFGEAHKQPTFTQFIPELYYFEKVGSRVICSSAGGMPLVRYDLKDRGGTLTLAEVKAIYKQTDKDLFKEAKKRKIDKKIWQLPFVYLFERDDLTVSIYSVNIYPESIRKALQKLEHEDRVSGKFTMEVSYDAAQNQKLEIHLELKDNVKHNKKIEEAILKSITESLLKENSEWRDFYSDESIRHKVMPKLQFWPYQHPQHFKPGGKQKWVKKQKI